MSKTDLEQLDEEIVVDMNADYSDEFWDKAHTQEASGKMGEICEGRHSPKGKHPNHKRINIARLWLKHRDELAFVSLLDKFLDFGALECFFELENVRIVDIGSFDNEHIDIGRAAILDDKRVFGAKSRRDSKVAIYHCALVFFDYAREECRLYGDDFKALWIFYDISLRASEIARIF